MRADKVKKKNFRHELVRTGSFSVKKKILLDIKRLLKVLTRVKVTILVHVLHTLKLA